MAKLPNGVTQRKDGLYVGRFQYQGIRYNVTDQDMKKCADKLEKMKYEIKNGIYCKESVVTGQQLVSYMDRRIQEANR